MIATLQQSRAGVYVAAAFVSDTDTITIKLSNQASRDTRVGWMVVG